MTESKETEQKEPESNKQTPPSLKEAYGVAVGIPAAGLAVMALLWPTSLFIACFTVGMMAVPMALDKKGTATQAVAEYKDAFKVVAADVKSRLGLNKSAPPSPPAP